MTFIALLLTLVAAPASSEAHSLEGHLALLLSTILQEHDEGAEETHLQRQRNGRCRTIAQVECEHPRHLIRVTFAGRDAQRDLHTVLNALTHQPVLRFDQQTWEIISVDLAHPIWAGISTWADMIAPPQGRFIRLRFVTPLALCECALEHRGGMLFPQPRHLFSDLLRQWRGLDGPSLSEDIESRILQDGCVVSDYALRLEVWKLLHATHMGWLGWIIYDCRQHHTPLSTTLHALAQLASFTGAGCCTDQGMGAIQVARYIKEGRGA